METSGTFFWLIGPGCAPRAAGAFVSEGWEEFAQPDLLASKGAPDTAQNATWPFLLYQGYQCGSAEGLGQDAAKPCGCIGDGFRRRGGEDDQRRVLAQLNGQFCQGPAIAPVCKVHVEDQDRWNVLFELRHCLRNAGASRYRCCTRFAKSVGDVHGNQAIVFHNQSRTKRTARLSSRRLLIVLCRSRHRLSHPDLTYLDERGQPSSVPPPVPPAMLTGANRPAGSD